MRLSVRLWFPITVAIVLLAPGIATMMSWGIVHRHRMSVMGVPISSTVEGRRLLTRVAGTYWVEGTQRGVKILANGRFHRMNSSANLPVEQNGTVFMQGDRLYFQPDFMPAGGRFGMINPVSPGHSGGKLILLEARNSASGVGYTCVDGPCMSGP